MCRPSSHRSSSFRGLAIGALLLAGIACLVGRAGADDVAAYLERRSLSQLLALHFEEELAVRTGRFVR